MKMTPEKWEAHCTHLYIQRDFELKGFIIIAVRVAVLVLIVVLVS